MDKTTPNLTAFKQDIEAEKQRNKGVEVKGNYLEWEGLYNTQMTAFTGTLYPDGWIYLHKAKGKKKRADGKNIEFEVIGQGVK